MLSFALTNVGHTLESACKAFGVEHGKIKTRGHGTITEQYIDYNRRDVLATAELLLKLREEFSRHPITLDPCKAYSPATISKSYLKEMRIIPPAKKFANISKGISGYAMTAYFGGRAECRIRNVGVPVVALDFRSMYPTVNTLMGLWPLMTAESLQVVDATEEVRELLKSLTMADCFERGLWERLRFFALIQPNGNPLPVRAEYGEGGNRNIAVNRLTSDAPLWFAGPDLVASTLLGARAPKVMRAFKLVPHGLQDGLQPVHLRGAVHIDPRSDDFFRVMVEQRQKLKHAPDLSIEERERLNQSLKVNANSGSYGIFAEMNPQELDAKERASVKVYGISEPFTCTVAAPEEPGEFFFAPIAALIPAAARLMLALLERCVTDMGGTYASCDTDSMTVVATDTGGHLADLGLKDLSWADVDDIVRRFAALNPYDPDIVQGSILKVEDENFRDGKRVQLHELCISAKRYALFCLNDDGGIELRKCSEHGLGHLLNPLDPEEQQSTDREQAPQWIQSLWEVLIRRERGEKPKLPEWIDRPALSRVGATTPDIVRRLNHAHKRAPYAEQVKPTNFVLAAHVKPMGHPEGVDPERFQLIAPYSSDPREWPKLKWIDRYSGNTYPIMTRDSGDAHVARVKCYRDALEEYATHPEPKSAGSDGQPCSRSTRGLLKRRHVHAAGIYYVGKESNFLEEIESGFLHDPEEVQQTYLDSRQDPWTCYVVPVLKDMPRKAEIAQSVGISERYIQFLRNGSKRRPSPTIQAKLTRAAADFAREQLGADAPNDDVAACSAYLQRFPACAASVSFQTRLTQVRFKAVIRAEDFASAYPPKGHLLRNLRANP